MFSTLLLSTGRNIESLIDHRDDYILPWQDKHIWAIWLSNVSGFCHSDIWLEHENKVLNAQELIQRNHLYVKTRKRNDSIDTAFGQ